jgi:hypothetical protein
LLIYKTKNKTKSTGPGRYKTDKPVAKNAIKPKNGHRPKNRGKQKQNRSRGAAAEPTKSTDLWTRVLNFFAEVCVGSYNFFISKPQCPRS